MKLFAGVFFAILLIGGIGLLSLYLAGNMGIRKEPLSKQSPERIKFPESVAVYQSEEELESFEGKYGEILADSEKMAEQNIYTKQGEGEGVSLVFGGDILFDDRYATMATSLKRKNGIEDSITNETREIMKNADICMVNNEFPYSERGEATLDKTFTFRAKPEYAQNLKKLGVDIVSLANNHAYDYGEAALLDTFDILKQQDVLYVGAGRDIEEAARPLYYIINDIKIALIAATQIERLDNPDTKEATIDSPGVFRCWNAEKLYETIREAEKNSDFVVVFVHWGTENQIETDWAQKDQAPKYVEAGADLIIGAHSHCLQPIEYIEGVPVIYSMGNFWFSSKTLDTALVRVVVNKEGLESYQFIPCKQEGSITDLLKGEEKQRVINHMLEISPGVSIDSEGYVRENK